MSGAPLSILEAQPTRLSASWMWVPCCVLVAYLGLLVAGWYGGNLIAIQLAIVPVATTAWYFGAPGALPLALGLSAVHLALLLRLGDQAGPQWLELGAGMLLLVLAGGGVGLLRDRIRAQLGRQKESEERYAIAAQGANDGLWDWDLRTQKVFYSEPLARLLGHEAHELESTMEAWWKRVHPDDVARVRAELSAHVMGATDRFEQEYRLQHRDGSWVWVLGCALAQRDADGQARRVAGWLTDIADRKQTEEELRHHAFHDGLTGLPNRALFMDRLANAIARSRRDPGLRFALMLLDLDRFKVVNDSLGHLAGDQLLQVVARRLVGSVRPGDTVGRLGGDEFMILLEEVTRPEDAEIVALRIHESLKTPLPLLGHEVVTTASLGIALGDHETISPHDLLRDADTAMYEAKNLGKGRHVRFDPHMHARAVERLSMENALREAVEAQQMRVHYQPIVDLGSGAIVGFEALARWEHPEQGMISPGQFIPLAEETGVISEIGQWILLAACSQLRIWQQQFERADPLRVSVNLSVRQMHSFDVADRIRGALETTRLPAHTLAMEITESVLMGDQSTGPKLLESIRQQGVKVYMDDFGTGYSSLRYLQQFRVDALKIDGSFVRHLDHSADSQSVVRSIVTLAKALGLKVVAEGVETPMQLRILRELGCDEAQGYLFARPCPPDEIEPLLRDDQRW